MRLDYTTLRGYHHCISQWHGQDLSQLRTDTTHLIFSVPFPRFSSWPPALRSERRPYLWDFWSDWKHAEAFSGATRHVLLRLTHADGDHLLELGVDPGYALVPRYDLDSSSLVSVISTSMITYIWCFAKHAQQEPSVLVYKHRQLSRCVTICLRSQLNLQKSQL